MPSSESGLAVYLARVFAVLDGEDEGESGGDEGEAFEKAGEVIERVVAGHFVVGIAGSF